MHGLLAAASGGALGALVRLDVGTPAPVHPGLFPWSTFAINVAGSAMLAALPAWPLVRRRAWLPAFLGTGVLGGFTTMSAASAEAASLLRGGDALLGRRTSWGPLGLRWSRWRSSTG